jgi:lysophospholipase L1-like esterase
MRSTFTWIATVLLMVPAMLLADEPATTPHAKWEKAIAAFEQKDAAKTPPKEGIVFVGSSSIVGWKLEEYFSGLPVIKRGFGGSQLADSVHFAPRIVTRYEPKTVVLYAGDNDLAAGKSPEQVAADFDAFVKVVHEKLPKTKIIYIAVKPSIARWKLIDKVRATNKLIAEACAKDSERLVFLDIDPLMLKDDGEPDPALFVKDGLHMSPLGYERWSKALRPHLE